MPLITPAQFAALATFNVAALSREADPLKVNSPAFTAPPNPTTLVIVNGFAIVLAVPELLEIRPPLNATNPVPNAASFPASIVPALSLTPPLNVFDPVAVNTADPFFTSKPVPLITPPNTVSTDPLKVSVLPCRFTNPSPASPAITSLLASFKLPPAFTLSCMLLARALPPLSVRSPAFTAVVPLYVFTPLSVSSASPSLTRL